MIPANNLALPGTWSILTISMQRPTIETRTNHHLRLKSLVAILENIKGSIYTLI